MSPIRCLVLAALTSAAAAEDASSPTVLPEVTIEAETSEAALTAPGMETVRQQVQQTAGGANVTDTRAFDQGRTENMEDLFRLSPGFYVSSIDGGQASKVSIRGSGIQADNPLGIQFLLDGIPFNEGDGEAVLEDFDLAGVRGAEVYRGANALRYGGLALGGAVNFVSKTGYDADPLGVRIEAGSYGYQREVVDSGFVKGRWDAFASAGVNAGVKTSHSPRWSAAETPE